MTTPAGEMGIVFDFTKKSPGTGVTSRYVDLLAHDDLAHGSAVSLEGLKPTLDALGLHLSQAWSFQSAGATGDPEGTVATYKGLDAKNEPTSLVGVSTYPFALTTPNYRGTMRLDFGYTIDDAVVAVVATVGKETRTAVLTPQGSFQVDKVNLADVIEAGSAVRDRDRPGIVHLRPEAPRQCRRHAVVPRPAAQPAAAGQRAREGPVVRADHLAANRLAPGHDAAHLADGRSGPRRWVTRSRSTRTTPPGR